MTSDFNDMAITKVTDAIYKTIADKYSDIKAKRGFSKPLIIGIDGNCGAGKTTLALHLKDVLLPEFKCSVVHMDHFFLPPELRKKKRLSSAGGNIHYERFIDEVIEPIKNDVNINYRVFDCSKMNYSLNIEIRQEQVIIFEGTYSLHPKWRKLIDIGIFININPTDQLIRLKKRSNINIDDFIRKWIPMENLYFQDFAIAKGADFLIDQNNKETLLHLKANNIDLSD